MNRLMVLAGAVMAGILVAQAKTSTPEGWIDDYDLALKRAAEENKYIVADFSGSDWCGWCKKLDREVFDTEVFRKGAADKYVLLMIDSPSDKKLLSEKAAKQNPGLVDKYGVRGFPTVLILDAKGEKVPPHMEAKKAELIDRQESRYKQMRSAYEDYMKSRKSDKD